MVDYKKSKYLSRRSVVYWSTVSIYALLIFFFSSISGTSDFFLSHIFMADKVVHLIEYSILGFLLFMAFSRAMSARKRLLLSFLLASLYGMTDELHQYFVPLREADAMDLLADSLGGLLGGYLAMTFSDGGSLG